MTCPARSGGAKENDPATQDPRQSPSLITHQDGCTRDRGANVAWVGGHGGRFYAAARSLNRSSALAEVQSRRSPAPRGCGVDPATTSMRMGLRAWPPRMRGCSLDQGWFERDPSEVLEHDLFNEDLHRRIKRGQARLGRLDAARRTFNLLETRFEAIDMEIDPSTRTLVHVLTRRSAT